MRILKEAEERKSEILDAAEQLFTTKGYSATTITDILTKVGIAKGTFYYYFKSKEEVMDAIVMRVIEDDVAQAKLIASDTSKTPTEKLFFILMGQKPQAEDNKNKLIEQFHEPSNAEIHQKSLSQSILCLSPILADVVRQGIDENIFATQYPQEAIEFLMVSGQIIFDTAIFSWTEEQTQRRIEAFIDLMEKSLGAKKGSFSFMKQILGIKETAGVTDNE